MGKKNNTNTSRNMEVIGSSIEGLDESAIAALINDDAVVVMEAEEEADAPVVIEAEAEIEVEAQVNEATAAEVVIEAEAEVVIAPEPDAAVEAEVEADALHAIEAQDALQEAIATQAATATPDTAPEVTVNGAPATTPRAPRAPRQTFSKTSEAILAKLGDGAGDIIVLESADATRDVQERFDEFAVIVDGSAKKIQEKAQNLIEALAGKATLSTYTLRCFEALVNEGGTINTKQLYAALLDGSKGKKVYTDGTARAQSNQMFTLFPMLKVVTRTGSSMTINDNSVIAMALKSRLAA